MAVDLSVFGKLKSKADFDREAEAWALAKREKMMARAGASLASVQFANEIQKARASGDTQRMNDLYMAAKSLDRGVVLDQNGNPVAMGGYADAVGSIAGTKKIYETQGQKGVELEMNPQIAGGEAGARQAQELKFAEPIAKAKGMGAAIAEQTSNLNKKVDQANSTSGLTQEARALLETGAPSGSYVSPAINFGKRLIGRSDTTTQANAKLAKLAADLTSAVPRMEGPQSNADLQFYREAAGNVGNTTLPIGDRLAALEQIDRINAKYADINTPTKQALGIPQVDTNDLEYGAPYQGSGMMPPPAPKLQKNDIAETLFNARKALKKGASPEAVRARLIENGIDPTQVGL